jgi:hypothetical protein
MMARQASAAGKTLDIVDALAVVLVSMSGHLPGMGYANLGPAKV